MKLLIIFIVVIGLFGCDQTKNEATTTDEVVIRDEEQSDITRNVEILGGYAQLEVHRLEVITPVKNSVSYISGYRYGEKEVKNTKNAVDLLREELNLAKGNPNAITDVFEVLDTGDKQCVVIKKEISRVTMTHELGHCFHPILFAVLERKYPSILNDDIKNVSKNSPYIIEGFAEVVAATRAYKIDGNFDYLKSRKEEITSKELDEYTHVYYEAVPLLNKLEKYLVSEKEVPNSIELQIEYITENFYTNKKYNDGFN
ncbi:hypothetical protein ACEWBX_22545 [Vibrio parahaemolyticus]